MLTKLRRLIQSTIGLSSSEANAMMVLLPVLFLTIFSEPLYRWYAQPVAPLAIQEEQFLDSMVSSLEPTVDLRSPDISLFTFDPNKATLDELKRLGISEIIGKRIIQYRTKGGQFRIKSDLAKIYGMDSLVYRSLVPFIELPEQLEKKVSEKKEPVFAVEFDINKADTTSLKSVKGIGSVLSKRIIKYREALGGFTAISQLREVYGLDSLVLLSLKSFYVDQNFQPKKLRINEATEVKIESHPYLSSRDARAIITYRMQHGKFLNQTDLSKIKILKESVVVKVAPYLSFE